MRTRGLSQRPDAGGTAADGRASWPWTVLGLGGALLVGAAHAGHDMLEGASAPQALLPTVPMVLQMLALSQLRTWARQRRLPWGAQAALLILVCLLFGVLFVLLHGRGGFWSVRPLTFWRMAVLGLIIGLAIGAVWLLCVVLPLALRDVRLRTVAAESVRRRAELERLLSSLQPHFVLNTLGAIAGLVKSEPDEAKRLLVALGDLLRDSIEPGPEVRAFCEDVEWLHRYAEILEVRHQGALRFRWELAPGTMSLRLPRLLLQPLVENAVKHGALRRGDGGVVTVHSEMVDGRAVLRVEDNGPGLSPDRREGLGLRLARERLLLACPRGELRLESLPEGTRATVVVPLEREVSL